MITLEAVKEFLRIDSENEDSFLTELITISQIYIESCVGTRYQADPDAITLSSILQLRLISDMYENRSNQVSGNIKTDRITSSILDKLSNH